MLHLALAVLFSNQVSMYVRFFNLGLHSLTGAHDLAWEKLSSSIQQIYAKNTGSLSFEENYRHAYNLVIGKQGAMLYAGLVGLITENLNKFANEKLVPDFPQGELDGRDSIEMCQAGETFVKTFREVWDDHESSMSKISDLVKYMVSQIGVVASRRFTCSHRFYVWLGPCLYAVGQRT